jgi:hypothetical protein
MHFVYNVDLIPPFSRGQIDLVAQVAYILYAGVGSGINLNQIQKTTLIDGLAWSTLITRTVGRIGVKTIKGFGKQARSGGFASATGPSKEVSVGNAPTAHGIAQGLHHVLLADYLFP